MYTNPIILPMLSFSLTPADPGVVGIPKVYKIVNL